MTDDVQEYKFIDSHMIVVCPSCGDMFISEKKNFDPKWALELWVTCGDCHQETGEYDFCYLDVDGKAREFTDEEFDTLVKEGIFVKHDNNKELN